MASAGPKRPVSRPNAGRPVLRAVPSQRQSVPRDDEWEMFWRLDGASMRYRTAALRGRFYMVRTGSHCGE